MNKKTIIGVISFVILTVGIIAGTLLVRENQDFRERAAPATQLSLTPASQTKNAGNNFVLTVVANTGENRIIGADLVINYDKNVIEVLSVTKGSSISGFDNVINSNIDANLGKIIYSVYTLNSANAVSGSNLELLTINAKVLNSATAGTYSFTFSDQTVLAGSGEGQNVVISKQPASIIIAGSGQNQSTATATATATSLSNATATATATATSQGVGGSGNNSLPTKTPTSTPKATNINLNNSSSTTTPFPVPVTGVSLSTILTVFVSLAVVAGSLLLVF